MRKVILLAMIGGTIVNAYGLTLANPDGYTMQTYAQYTLPAGQAKYAEFDGAGNLYVTHDGGHLVRVSPGGGAQVLERFNNLQGVFHAGGTAYGDTLYVNDASAGTMIAIQGDTSSTFSNVTGQPIGIALDRSGRFGSKLFVPALYSSGRIYAIDELGGAEVFTQLEGLSGHDIEFDYSGGYGGLMYVCTSDLFYNYSGIWAITPNRTAYEFCGQTNVGDLEFDTTETSAFGGLLYGRRSSYSIGAITADGVWSVFAGADNSAIKCLTFGPDNSMYVVEEIGDVVNVTKISAVPEPLTLLLMGMGGVLIRKRK